MELYKWKRNTVGDNVIIDIECWHCKSWLKLTCKEEDIDKIDEVAAEEHKNIVKVMQDACPYLDKFDLELLRIGLCKNCCGKI
jgi:hypothetical protein